MHWRTSGRRLLAAAAAAVVLHLLLAVGLMLLPQRPPRAPVQRRPAIEVVLGPPQPASVPAAV